MDALDFTKDFFQEAWGPSGYQEEFSYGIGIEHVCQVTLEPFFNKEHCALEIGPGGGSFTRRMVNQFSWLTAMDVIKMPQQFKSFQRFSYIELPNQCYRCDGVANSCIDYVFSYNVFCHLSDGALREYFEDIARVARTGAHFVFMLSNFEKVSKSYFPKEAHNFRRNQILPNGHFYQDEITIHSVADPHQWEIISPNLIPAHRDIVACLRKI